MMNEILNSYWHWFIIILVFANIFACWGLLRWSSQTKVDSHDNTTGHVWDEDLQELNNPLPRWWLILFHSTILFALVYLYFYPGLGNYEGSLKWSQVSQLEENMQSKADKAESLQESWLEASYETLSTNYTALKSGSRMYGQYCAMCHGSDAKGAKGYPDLSDDVWLWGSDIKSIETTIRKGRHAVMPGWSEQLSDSDITAVATYVQNLSGKAVEPELAAAGKIHFQKNCVACHGMEGKGLQGLGAPDLTNDEWLYGGSLTALESTIKNGRNGIMPAQESLMTEYEVKLLTAYVYSLRNKEN